MKLLFDQNQSWRLVLAVKDLFPGSVQVREFKLDQADDIEIWEYARAHGLTIVSLDSDFFDISLLRGHPPKLIWLRCGNCPWRNVEKLLRKNAALIVAFEQDAEMGALELYG